MQHYIPLLQVIFELEPKTQWHIAPWQEEYCNRAVMETYRSHFPQLWTRQNLIIRHDPKHPPQSLSNQSSIASSGRQINHNRTTEAPEGYILRLFISNEDSHGEQTLSNIHQLLEEGLINPYTLKVIDVAKNPEQAVIHRIASTPTLIRVSPKPVRRIVGQFNDIPRILKIISSF